MNAKQSANANETEAFDTSDELLDDLVKNATLTASRDALKQRKIARYGAQRRSRMFLIKMMNFLLIKSYIHHSSSSTDIASGIERRRTSRSFGCGTAKLIRSIQLLKKTCPMEVFYSNTAGAISIKNNNFQILIVL